MSSHSTGPDGHSLPYTQSQDEQPDLLEGLQNIPSNFNLSVNSTSHPEPRYLSPTPKPKDTEELQDPEHFRRLSVSSLSSYGPLSRSTSPFLTTSQQPTTRTWRCKIQDFWDRNQGLFLVTISQLFGALMNVTTRLLELEGDGMEPFQILFARQGLTAILCTIWMWWMKVPDFPLGAKSMRSLLVARSISGFFGIYGMYCKLYSTRLCEEVRLKRHRFLTVPTGCRCSSHHIPLTFSGWLCMLHLPPRTIPKIISIRLSSLLTRRNPHRTTDIILLLFHRYHHSYFTISRHNNNLIPSRSLLHLPRSHTHPTPQRNSHRPPGRPRFRRRIHLDPPSRHKMPSPLECKLLLHILHPNLFPRPNHPLPSQHTLQTPRQSPPMEHASLPRSMWFHDAVFTNEGTCGRRERRERGDESDEFDLYEYAFCDGVG